MIRMRTLFRLYILLTLLCASVSAMAQSKTYYVSPTGTGDGSSWQSTMTLSAALNAAKAGDQIWAQGFDQITKAGQLYTVPDQAVSFSVKSGVQLYGGFAGTEKSINDRETLGKPYQMKYRSVLSGDINSDDNSDNTNIIFPANTTRQDNATHVLSVDMKPTSTSGNNNTYPTVINGFTITGGHAVGTDAAGKGGGIYISGDNSNGGGNFRIERCFLFNNYATQGGAVYVDAAVKNVNNGESLINQCVVYNNAAGERAAVENQGGGIYLAGKATVVNTSIFNNENGGLRISSGSKVVNSTIARNTGAGVDMTDENASGNVANSIVWGNSSLSLQYRPTFNHSAFHEVTVTNTDAGTDDNGNVYVAKENRESASGPMFDAPSIKTSYDRDFNWRQTAYPLWSWNVLEGSVMIDKGNGIYYDTQTYGSEDMAGKPRISGTSISIGAYEYQYLPASRIRYVKPTATGTGDGSTWANASADLQKMIDELADNNPQNQTGEVWVAAGTYTPQSQLISGTGYSASFRMRDGISVYGGFDGTEASKIEREKASTMPWDFKNETILQAAYYDHNDFSWTNNKWTLTSDSRHVVWFAPMPGESAFTNVTTLDGVTIQGGYAQGGTGMDDFMTDRGAGVYMDGANAYLSNCIVKENYATGNGGGVYLKDGRVQTSLIYNNNADADGGAVYVENRGLVHRSMLANNSALNGAGVYLHNGAEATGSDSDDHPEYLILSTCVVSNNTVRGNGAVYCDKGGVMMQNTITNNNCVTATDATDTNASQTGGIYVDEYALVVNSVLWNNKMNGGTNIPMYARNPSADKVKFLYNAISGVNNAVWNNTLQQQTLSLVDTNAGNIDDGNSIGPRFTEPTEDMKFVLDNDYGVQSGWEDDIISYYWKPVDGSNLWARGMALGQLPDDVVLSPELDIEGDVFAQKPATGAFMVKAPTITPSFENDEDGNNKLVLYIDAECTEPSHDGSSWANAFRSLNNALAYCAALSSGENVVCVNGTHKLSDIDFFEIRVLEGDLWPRYAFTNNDPLTATITVPKTASGKTIYIYGGYHRDETDSTRNTAVRDPLTYRSIINGNTEAKDITQGLYHCITVEQGANVVFDGFHVINGYAAGEASRQYGAGLLAHTGSDVTVRNCIFENNTAQEGAAIDARAATLTMQNCVVNNNTNTTETASVVNAQKLTMEHVTVVNNIGAAPANTNNLYESSFSAGNSSNNTQQTLASTGETGAANFTNPTNAAGATLGFDTYLGGYSSFRPLTSSNDAGTKIINQAPTSKLTSDITTINGRDLGGVPDLGAYEADLPKSGRVYYVRTNGNDNNSGLSWNKAFATVRKAVETANTKAAVNGKKPQVWVSAGTYTQAPKSSSVNCFEILEGVDVYGAFPKTGNPGINDRHPFISTSVYNNYDGIYKPEDYETILMPSSNSGNRRVLGQADTYNPINAVDDGKYVSVGAGNGNYIYQDKDEYKEVGAGEGDYVYSANGGEYVSAAPEYCNYLKVEKDGWYKYVSNYEISATDTWFRPNTTKYFVYVGAGKGNYNIGNSYGRYIYTEVGDGKGSYVEFGGEKLYETAENVNGSYKSNNGYVQVPKGKGDFLLTETGYNQVGSGYGNYKYLTVGYHKVEQGQGDYIYKAENRFGVETIWDGFTLTNGYLDSDDLNDIVSNGYARDGGAGARIFTNVVLRNCIVVNNLNEGTTTGNNNWCTQTRGGGVYCDEGTLVNCYILKNILGKDNQYTAYGGGCYMYNGTAYNCVISENETNGYHGDGAGIFIENAAFYNNTIVKNTSNATDRGNGGICIWTSGPSSQLTIYNCIVLGNSGMKGDMIGSGDIAVSSNGGYINCNYSITSNTTNASRNNGAVTYNNSVVIGTSIFADYDRGNYRLGTMDGANMGIDEPIVNGTTIRLSEYTDMDFTDRIKDCRVDAGAYERSNIDNTGAEVVGNTRIFYVTQNGSGTTSGNSLTNSACATKLQIILNAAGELKKKNPNLTVIVKVAGYSESGTGFVYHANTLANEKDPQSYSYVVPYGVILEGGYNENVKNWSDESSRDIIKNPTKLSAIYEGTETKLSVNGYHTVTFGEKPADWTGGEQQTIIDGVWLTDGSANSMAGAGNPNTRGGGAIVPSGAHVRNCVVMNCEAIEGGGLYLMPGATVSGTLVMNNSAEYGGGVYADGTDVSKDSRAHILSCTIANNEASSTGGGLYMEDGAVMNVNTVVFGNKAGSDKNVSGVVNQQFEDSKLDDVFNITEQNSFYPFNSSFVETQEMPSDFENRMLESDKSLYFADDYYRLKDYSLLIKHGVKTDYQHRLVATFNVAESDMQNIARVQTGNGAYRLDAGAFAYEGGILPTDLFTRIFVSQTTNVTLPEGSDMNDYLGRSFYTSFSTLEDALGYIRSMREDGKNADTKFEILVAGGTYKPSYQRTTGAQVDQDQKLYSFVVPQGVSIYGGFSGTEKYSSSSSTDTGFTNIGTEVTDLNVDGNIEDILKARTYSDFNQNNIMEPWELANQTILSGQINVSSTAQNAYHVVFTSTTATDVNPVVLDGLTVMYGQTDNKLSISTDENEQGRGGGIYSNGVTYTISRCRLLNNTAVRGGAVFVRNADLNLSGCILAGNKTVPNRDQETTTLTNRGGAAYVSGIDNAVNLRAVNTLWANNESGGEYGEGGAIGTNYAGVTSAHDPFIYILNNTFVRNKATKNPVLYNHNGKSELVNTLIWGNEGASYDDATSVAEIYNVSHCASDVDYIGKFTSGNSNNNILLSTDNMNDEGPRFTNPSTTAGVAGNSASSLWNPVAISVVTDAGDGTEHTATKNPDETDAEHKFDGTVTGAYQQWFKDNTDVTEAYITGGTYSRYSGPRGQNNEELCKPIDIGLYEYQYVSKFSTMPAIYVDTLSRGTGSGDGWANATDDLRGAIVGAANPEQEIAERVIYVRDGNYSWSRLSANSAYILNMSTNDNYSKSLTLKGSCTGSGHQQDFSKPTVIRNDGTTTTLMSVSANSKAVTFEGFTFINDTGTGMDASTGTGSLTLKNCGFRISNTGLNISGNSGKMLIYNTLFADGGTGISKADASTTIVNATFANNTTADMTFAGDADKPSVYNSVSWNNGENKMEGNDSEQDSPTYFNKVFSFTVDAAENNTDIQKGPNFVDPLNINEESRDYHIRPSVQLLNKGNNQNYIDHVVKVVSDADATEIPSTEVDLGNNARLVDNSIDIGAYEYEAPLQPIVYVKPDLTGAADGKSWETALGDLQGAVDLAGLYALNHQSEKATGYVFVHGNYHDTGSLNLSLGNTKVYGGMNDERSTETGTEDIVSDLLGKRKGIIENSNRSSLENVTISADGVVDGFVVTGTATVKNGGLLSTSIVTENGSVTGMADGLLYNSLVLGEVEKVKAVNVTATKSLDNVAKDGSGNNRASVTKTNTYVTDDYWKYQLMESSADIDAGTITNLEAYTDLVGHERDLIGNKRIRKTVDNGCFETWNISKDMTLGNIITATDYPVGKSVVYVRKGQELMIENATDGTLVYKDEASAFNPGFLLLEHQAGLRGNGNYISLTNLAVERDVAEGGNDLAAMPFKVTGISQDGSDGTNESYVLKRYSGSKRAAYDYTFDSDNGGAWTDQYFDGGGETEGFTDQNFSNRGETEGFLIKNGNTAAPITVRFYGKSENQNDAIYKEDGEDKTISLMKYNFNEPWTSATTGGNRFTHKENMSWNLFGSPYLCAMNYSDMEYGRVIYGYGGNKYNTIKTANETSGYIPAGDAVFTQTATLKDYETVNVSSSAKKNGDSYAATSSLSVSIKRTGEVSEDDAAYGDILQLDAVPASEARNEFDMSADGVKWMAGGEAQIYATRSGGRYSLLSAVSIDGKVAVGVTVPEPGMYTIAVPDDCMAEDYETVVLDDAVTGRSVDLLEGGYDFTTVENGDIIGRFNISFNRKADADGNIRAYFTADDIIRVEGVEPGDNISVYSVDGMRVASVTASSNVEDVRASVAVVAIVKAGGKTVKIRK